MIKAVLFDMNGIIIDDEHIHELAFKETLIPFGINLTHKVYLECFAGKTDRAGYKEIFKKFKVELPVDSLLKIKAQRYLELFPANKKTYPGVIELIKTLAKDFILTVTSSSSRAELDLIIKEFDIRHFFKITVSADEVKKGKPDPEPYLITAQILELKPEECVVIEDSKSGVLSAKAAGCYCIGVTTTHDIDALGDSDLIVDSFDKINQQVIRRLEK